MIEEYGNAVSGGLLIGLSATLLLFSIGYPVGISGFLSRAMGVVGKADWRLSFLGGMLLVAFVVGQSQMGNLATELASEKWKIALAAICVGVGSRIAGGCTSGHSLCGISRLDTDSILATVIFISSGALTVLFLGV